MLGLFSWTNSCYDNKSDKFKFSSKVINKRVLEGSGDRLRANYRKVFDDAFNFTSRNRGIRTQRDKF